MKPLVYVGIALHPQAQARLEASAVITHDPDQLRQAQGAIVYSPEESWTRRRDLDALRALGCHLCPEPVKEWSKEKKIAVTEAESLWHTVAEHTLALLMSAVRKIPQADQSIRRGEWTDHETLKVRFSGWDFQGKTMGIWGMGRIGKELAELVSGFRMRVLYQDVVRWEEGERRWGLVYRELDDLLRESDFLIMLLPLNEETQGIMGAREIAQMKFGSILVNTARAGLIQQEPLLEALRSGKISAAALDVQWQEPTPAEHPVCGLDSVVLTPHLGGSTLECDMTLVDAVLAAL